MKKKIRIGIPRAFLYYRYYILWKTFFEGLGCKVILSPITNKLIIDEGRKTIFDDYCLSSKIYMGHISFLCDKCDYVLIPRVFSYGKDKKVCNKFNDIYNIVLTIFPELDIISYDIDNLKFKYEILGFINMGFKVNKNIFKILYYYYLGKRKSKQYNLTMIRNQENVLRTNKPKVLIISHPYVIYDEFFGNIIVNYLKDNEIQVLYSDRLDRGESTIYANDYLKLPCCLYVKEIIGSFSYYKNVIDGVIFLSSSLCEFFSYINEIIYHNIEDIPFINFVIDDMICNYNIFNKMNSFVNNVKKTYNNK